MHLARSVLNSRRASATATQMNDVQVPCILFRRWSWQESPGEIASQVVWYCGMTSLPTQLHIFQTALDEVIASRHLRKLPYITSS